MKERDLTGLLELDVLHRLAIGPRTPPTLTGGAGDARRPRSPTGSPGLLADGDDAPESIPEGDQDDDPRRGPLTCC